MRCRAAIVATIALSSLTSCAKVADEGDAVDQFVAELMERTKTPGISIAILDGGKTVKSRSYGVSDLTSKTPATGAAIYPLRSTTKAITATGFMMLVEEGKVALEDKVAKHLPDLPTVWGEITIRQLLDHTSGLPEVMDETGDQPIARYREKTREAALRLAASLPLLGKPGESYNYVETNYILVGMVIEKLSGMSFSKFMEQRIFRPLGMDSTRYGELPEASGGKTTYYISFRVEEGEKLKDLEVPEAINDEVPEYDYPGAGLNTTADDLARFDAALGAGKLLKPASLEAMWESSPHSRRLSGYDESGYGLGWGVSVTSGRKSVSMVGGGSACYWRMLDDHLTLIVLSNCRGALGSGIGALIAAYRLSKPSEVESARNGGGSEKTD